MLKTKQLCLADIVLLVKRIFRDALSFHGFPELIIFYQIIRTFSLFFLYYRGMIKSNKRFQNRNPTKERNMERVKNKKKGFMGIWVLVRITVIVAGGIKRNQEKSESYSEIPDVVSSFASNKDYHLLVISNSSAITDKEELSKKIIEMCRNNSFQSMIFSTDINGYPGSLDIDVYLQKEDIGKKNAELKIQFQPDEWNADYNIRDDIEHYRLYVDEKIVDL